MATASLAAPSSSSAAPSHGAHAKRSPSDFLKTVIGRPVVVRLHNGVDYRGVLASLDAFLNLAMEQTEEWTDGVLTNRYGDCFIRGNNGAWPPSRQ